MEEMFKGLNRLRHEEGGFTVVEIVVAAFILFFALTALIGLLGMSTNLTASARSKSVLNNAISAEMDRIRSLPYSGIAYRTGPTSTGQVVQERSEVIEGFRISYVTTIVDRSGTNGTKEVTIVGTCVREGFPPTSSRMFAAVRNRVGGITTGTGNVPVVQFMSMTPRADAILIANRTSDGVPIDVGVRATTTGENSISRIEIVVGVPGSNALMRNSATAHYTESSEKDFTGDSTYAEFIFRNWYTTQVAPVIPDGRRVIRAIAYDQQGRASAPRERTFIVDNVAPSAPTNVVLTGRVYADMTQDLLPSQWTVPLDGTDPAPYIEADIKEDQNGASDPEQWATVVQLQTPSVVAAEPFGRYALRVRALSPMREKSPWAVSPRVFTRPIINGTSDVTRARRSASIDRWTFVTRLQLPAPRFPYASGATVQLLENGTPVAGFDSAAALAAWGARQPYSVERTLVMDLGKNATPTAPQYQLRAVLTPLGFGGGSPVTITSNFARAWGPSDEALFEYTVPPSTISSTGMPLTRTWQ